MRFSWPFRLACVVAAAACIHALQATQSLKPFRGPLDSTATTQKYKFHSSALSMNHLLRSSPSKNRKIAPVNEAEHSAAQGDQRRSPNTSNTSDVGPMGSQTPHSDHFFEVPQFENPFNFQNGSIYTHPGAWKLRGAQAPGSQAPERHRELLRGCMESLGKAMLKLGMLGECSAFSSYEVEHLAAAIIDYVFVNSSYMIPKPHPAHSWRSNGHPVSKTIRKINHNWWDRHGCDDFHPKMVNHLNAVLEKLDDRVIAFLAGHLYPLVRFMKTSNSTDIEKKSSIIQYLCLDILSLSGVDELHCEKDLHFLADRLIANELGYQTTKARIKRSRSGYSGTDLASPYEYPHTNTYNSYPDYETSATYVAVADHDDYYFAYPILIKFLAAVAIGTYGFLGLLVFQTVLSYYFISKTGAPGRKGESGQKGMLGVVGDNGLLGDKGENANKGIQGMKGMKGMNGTLGDPGDAGAVGEKGPKGQFGLKGIKGVTGMKGPKGFLAPEGAPGSKGDNGMKAVKGMKGVGGVVGQKGEEKNQGMKGDKGMTGSKGVKGNDTKGDEGIPGICGPKGVEGSRGLEGKKCVKGEIGQTGKLGEEAVNGNNGGSKDESFQDGSGTPSGLKTWNTEGGTGDESTTPDSAGDDSEGETTTKDNTIFGVMVKENLKPSDKDENSFIIRQNTGSQNEDSVEEPDLNLNRWFFLYRPKRAAKLDEVNSPVSLLDASRLLDDLYKEQLTGQRLSPQTNLFDAINGLWEQHEQPGGCVRCLLYKFLSSQGASNLDKYIAAGFAHVLGDAGSLQLQADLRRAQHKGLRTRCRRKKSSCQLEYESYPSYPRA